MAIVSFRNYGILEAGDNPNTLGIAKPTNQNAGMLIEPTGRIIWLWNNSGPAWVSYDLGAFSSSSGDGNHTPITRANTTENIAPTAGEIPSPISGDTASVYLTNGTLEYWVHNGSTWSKAFSVNAQTISSALVTLSGVPAGSTDLGTFPGTTIGDNLTIKQAIAALETALETAARTVADTASIDLSLSVTGELTGNVRVSATPGINHTVVIDTDGLEIGDVAASGPYDSHALATADGALPTGKYYYLSPTNLEFVYSQGAKGPYYRK